MLLFSFELRYADDEVRLAVELWEFNCEQKLVSGSKLKVQVFLIFGFFLKKINNEQPLHILFSRIRITNVFCQE